MAYAYTAGRRQARLLEIAKEVASLEIDLLQPQSVTGFNTPVFEDAAAARAVLEHHRKEEFEAKRGFLRLSRQPSKKAFRPDEVDASIRAALQSNASPEQIQALFVIKEGSYDRKFQILKRKSVPLPPLEISDALQRATNQKNHDLIRVLVSKTDSNGRDRAFATAVSLKDRAAMAIFLEQGVSPENHKMDLKAAIEAEDFGMVTMLLSGKVKFEQNTLDAMLVLAASLGHAQSLAALLFHGANANAENAEPLLAATRLKRKDIMAALCLSRNPPMQEGLKRAFDRLSNTQPPKSNGTQLLVELLLAAGTSGDCVASYIVTCCKEIGNNSLVATLLDYGGSVSYKRSEAMFQCMLRSDIDLLTMLLQAPTEAPAATTALSRASESLRLIDSSSRVPMFDKLLAQGGDANNDERGFALVCAIKAKDAGLTQCMLRNLASVDHMNGEALCETVKHELRHLFDLLVDQPTKPSTRSLNRAFGELTNVSATNRVAFARPLLKMGASGEEVNQLLSLTIREASPSPKDYALIRMLVDGGADVNSNHCLQYAVQHCDEEMIEILVAGQPSANSISTCVPYVQELQDRPCRLRIMRTLLGTGTIIPAVHDMVIAVAHEVPPDRDREMLQLLCGAGHADVNHRSGEAIRHSVQTADLSSLTILLGCSVSQQTLNEMVHSAVHIADHSKRLLVFTQLLKRGAAGKELDSALASVSSVRPAETDFDLIRLLIETGASTDFNNGESFRAAIGAANVELVRLLLTGKPATTTLASIIPLVFSMADSTHRLTCAELILDSAGNEIANTCSDLLVRCVEQSSYSIELLEMFFKHGASADYNEGVVLCFAVTNASPRVVKVILNQVVAPATLQRAFKLSLRAPGNRRITMTELLLSANAERKVLDLDLALIATVQETDRLLVQLLLQHDASVHQSGSKCVSEAIHAADPEILQLLLLKIRKRDTVSQLFSSAIQQTELWCSVKGLQCLSLLLEHGATGVAVDAALRIAVDLHKPTNASKATKALIEGPRRNFMDALIHYGAGLDFADGASLISAYQQGNRELIGRLLHAHPSADLCSKALPHFLVSQHASAEETVALLTDLRLHFNLPSGPEIGLSGAQSGFAPMTFLCIARWPREPLVLEALLKIGCSANEVDEKDMHHPCGGEKVTESVSALVWAISNLETSEEVIAKLITGLAYVNFRCRLTGTTPLLAAVVSARVETVRLLIQHGADMAVSNVAERTPLLMASNIGDTRMVSSILTAEALPPDVNDGSLQEAARNCHLKVLQLLIQHRHDPSHPSSLHQGRNALQEAALKCDIADARLVQRMFEFLFQTQVDSKCYYDGKPLFLLALDNRYNSIVVTKALWHAFMYKHINESFNLYSEDSFVYSPLTYLRKGLQQSPKQSSAELQSLLQSTCKEVYYRKIGEQPDDMIFDTAPREAQENFLARQRLKEREAQEEREHQLRIRRQIDLFQLDQDHTAAASGQRQQLAQQEHRLTLERTKETAGLQLTIARDADLQAEKFAEHRREEAVKHQRRMDQERLNTTKVDNQLQLEYKQKIALQDQAVIDANFNAQAKMLEMESSNRREQEKSAQRQRQIEDQYDNTRHNRQIREIDKKMEGIKQQKKLLNAQRELANNVARLGSPLALPSPDDYYSPD